MNHAPVSRNKMVVSFMNRVLVFSLIWMAVFFLPAGTFDYWQAWVVLGILFLPIIISIIFYTITDPGMLESRAKTEEKEAEQKIIMKLFGLVFVLTFLIPGFDHRYGWSHVPDVLAIIACVLLLIGFGLCFVVLHQNRYASRIIEVGEQQQVISSGVYSIVRHPMYSGVVLMCLSLPLALASYWAFIPALFILPVLVARIKNEESVLIDELAGYEEYTKQIKYRLIPGIW
ncbi:MAG: isoprenylcysteine carboxylmethyltransferase family protein [Anaerolineaceae bacterium]|nr:isoprenylcysteine carboxylmethyltransferase family protein [Anaerolineaceae bacterium]